MKPLSVEDGTEKEDRCGWMREGGERQCIYSAGHSGIHEWESEEEMLARTSAYEQELTDYQEGVQEMPQMPSVGGCEIQSEESGAIL